MYKFPETDDEIRKLTKEKGDHHDQVSLNNDDLDAHLLVLPKELRARVTSAESQVRTGELIRIYISCANYTPLSVEMGFETRVSDPVVTVAGQQTSGRFTVPTVTRGQKAGVNWRFSALQATVPNSRAEVICEWSPAKMDRGRGGETIVKITTTT